MKKRFSGTGVLLCAAGLFLNIGLVWLTKALEIPLFLDSIGTILVGALGGLLPGIAVGFLSNCITALTAVSPDPMTLYYGIVNLLIAAAAYWFSIKGLLVKWQGRLLAVVTFAALGGGVGFLITWVLYGFSFGGGISAPLTLFFHGNWGFSEFAAQLSADMSIDLLDKLVSVTAACMVLDFLPAAILDKLPMGCLYYRYSHGSSGTKIRSQLQSPYGEKGFAKRSIRTNITLLIFTATTILSILALYISTSNYRSRLIDQYTTICSNAAALIPPNVDGDGVEEYLALGEQAEGYIETEQALYKILHNTDSLAYIYVYAVRADGCHVVFDLNTPQLAGDSAGTVVPFDAFSPRVDLALAGAENLPVSITDDQYGWLLTVYKPIKNTQGQVVAYAAADLDMQDIKPNVYSFFISIASLLFGIMLLIAAFSIWYCDKRLLEPIGVLALQAKAFDFTGEHTGRRVRDRYTVQSGDELEEVFTTMCRTEDAIAKYVGQVHEKNLEISHMQRNIIYALANMVENRDGNTGGHIKRTAAYVQLIGERLQTAGLYPQQINDAYVKTMFESAPLHDIGKIKVSDSILNKPGPLTAQEFIKMKTHTTAGADILRSSLVEIEDKTWLATAIDMAEYHHERWDGKGYPIGLAGEEIPLCARIIAVCDVFDALVSVRCYKDPIPFEVSMQIIMDGAGTQFDPAIVQAFVGAKEAVLAISKLE